MREIHLIGDKIAFIDDADFSEISKYVWRAVRAQSKNDNWYARRSETGPDGKTKNIYMHRELLGLSDHEEADHKDRDGLNNCRDNLRVCSRKLNCANIALMPPASGYRGVYRHRRKWTARATENRKNIYLGLFSDPASAARARDQYVWNTYGEFAVLNFPREVEIKQ